MKKWIVSLLMGALVMMSSLPAFAMGEKNTNYDTSYRVTFGLGYGKKAVREEDFGDFLKTVVTPTFKDGYCSFEAQGQWMHPERGLVREKNIVIFMDVIKGADNEAGIRKVAEEYLRRFPGSNGSVYVVETPITSAKVYF